MSCSALFETSRTYRNRLSTPSGNPSIAMLLLEALGHRVDRLERRFRLQFLRDDRRLEALRRHAEVIVDDDVVVELFPGVDLGDRLAQPRLDLGLGVEAPIAQPLLEHVERRRKDEDIQRTLSEMRVPGDLLRPLVVDVENDVLAAFEARRDLGDRGSVLVVVN